MTSSWDKPATLGTRSTPRATMPCCSNASACRPPRPARATQTAILAMPRPQAQRSRRNRADDTRSRAHRNQGLRARLADLGGIARRRRGLPGLADLRRENETQPPDPAGRSPDAPLRTVVKPVQPSARYAPTIDFVGQLSQVSARITATSSAIPKRIAGWKKTTKYMSEAAAAATASGRHHSVVREKVRAYRLEVVLTGLRYAR